MLGDSKSHNKGIARPDWNVQSREVNAQEIRSEGIRLSEGIAPSLAGKFAFEDDGPADGPRLVSTERTNERMLLPRDGLRDFHLVDADSNAVTDLSDLTQREPCRAEDVAVGMLIGGLSFRSGGVVNPQLEVDDPTGRRVTLLGLQLERFAASPLGADGRLYLFGNPLNPEAQQRHVAELDSDLSSRFYVGGVAPRLEKAQHADGPLLFHRMDGEVAYNPIGHLEVLRWLIVLGTLGEIEERRLFVTCNYSNWGRIFDSRMLRIARWADGQMRDDPDCLFVAETTPEPKDTRSGSLLAERQVAGGRYSLVKYAYGSGSPALPAGSRALVSTNTLYFGVEKLLRRLAAHGAAIDLPESRASLRQLLADARDGRRREETAALFDAAFPVPPIVIPGKSEGKEFLRIERDLDMLSLLPDGSHIQAIKVPKDRGVFIKLPADLEDPEKTRYLFAS